MELPAALHLQRRPSPTNALRQERVGGHPPPVPLRGGVGWVPVLMSDSVRFLEVFTRGRHRAGVTSDADAAASPNPTPDAAGQPGLGQHPSHWLVVVLGGILEGSQTPATPQGFLLGGVGSQARSAGPQGDPASAPHAATAWGGAYPRWHSGAQWRRPQSPSSAPGWQPEFGQHFSLQRGIVLGGFPRGFLAALGTLWPPSALSALKKIQNLPSAPGRLAKFA